MSSTYCVLCYSTHVSPILLALFGVESQFLKANTFIFTYFFRVFCTLNTNSFQGKLSGLKIMSRVAVSVKVFILAASIRGKKPSVIFEFCDYNNKVFSLKLPNFKFKSTRNLMAFLLKSYISTNLKVKLRTFASFEISLPSFITICRACHGRRFGETEFFTTYVKKDFRQIPNGSS